MSTWMLPRPVAAASRRIDAALEALRPGASRVLARRRARHGAGSRGALLAALLLAPFLGLAATAWLIERESAPVRALERVPPPDLPELVVDPPPPLTGSRAAIAVRMPAPLALPAPHRRSLAIYPPKRVRVDLADLTAPARGVEAPPAVPTVSPLAPLAAARRPPAFALAAPAWSTAWTAARARGAYFDPTLLPSGPGAAAEPGEDAAPAPEPRPVAPAGPLRPVAFAAPQPFPIVSLSPSLPQPPGAILDAPPPDDRPISLPLPTPIDPPVLIGLWRSPGPVVDLPPVFEPAGSPAPDAAIAFGRGSPFAARSLRLAAALDDVPIRGTTPFQVLVPEPTSAVLLLGGFAALAGLRRRALYGPSRD